MSRPKKWVKHLDARRLPKYALVLQAHEQLLGRNGISVHALATILGKSANKLLAAMTRRRSNARVYHCGTVNAPVWCPSYSDWGEHDQEALKEARDLLKKYPWPKYKGVLDMKGTRTLTEFEPDELRILRKAARGWTINKDHPDHPDYSPPYTYDYW